eukprot:5508351-Pleurochrysis_carterae.AAC.1
MSVVVAFLPPRAMDEERARRWGAVWQPLRIAGRGSRGTPFAIAQEYAQAWADTRAAPCADTRTGAVTATPPSRDAAAVAAPMQDLAERESRAQLDLLRTKLLLAAEAERGGDG